jgi:hypothetical protein
LVNSLRTFNKLNPKSKLVLKTLCIGDCGGDHEWECQEVGDKELNLMKELLELLDVMCVGFELTSPIVCRSCFDVTPQLTFKEASKSNATSAAKSFTISGAAATTAAIWSAAVYLIMNASLFGHAAEHLRSVQPTYMICSYLL